MSKGQFCQLSQSEYVGYESNLGVMHFKFHLLTIQKLAWLTEPSCGQGKTL